MRHTAGLGALVAALVTGAAGLVALYAFGVMVLCLSFRVLQLQSLVYLMQALLDFGRWPAQVFPAPPAEP